MKRGVIVLGLESTGTRNLTRILIESGFVGSSVHIQPLMGKEAFLSINPQQFVIRYSAPHNSHLYDIHSILEYFKNLGYSMMVMITTRDWHSMISSQVANNHGLCQDHTDPYKYSEKRSANAQVWLSNLMATLEYPYEVLSYETLLLYPKEVSNRIKAKYDISFPDDLCHEDANRKYYNLNGE